MSAHCASLMFMEDHLFAMTQRPAALVCSGAFRAVSSAWLRVFSCGGRTVSERDVRFREAIGIVHPDLRPAAENQVEVVRNVHAAAANVVYQTVLLGKAQDLAVRITLGDVDHVAEV